MGRFESDTKPSVLRALEAGWLGVATHTVLAGVVWMIVGAGLLIPHRSEIQALSPKILAVMGYEATELSSLVIVVLLGVCVKLWRSLSQYRLAQMIVFCARVINHASLHFFALGAPLLVALSLEHNSIPRLGSNFTFPSLLALWLCFLIAVCGTDVFLASFRGLERGDVRKLFRL